MNDGLSSISGEFRALLFGGIDYDIDSAELINISKSFDRRNSSNLKAEPSLHLKGRGVSPGLILMGRSMRLVQ